MKRKSSQNDALQGSSTAKKARFEIAEGNIASGSDDSHNAQEEETLMPRRGRSMKEAPRAAPKTYSKKSKGSTTSNGVTNGSIIAKPKSAGTGEEEDVEDVPAKKSVGRPRGPNWTPKKLKEHDILSTAAKGTNGNNLISTPLKLRALVEEEATPTIPRNADRSARRKTVRNLIERTWGENASDLEDDEDELALDIYGEEIVDDVDEQEEEQVEREANLNLEDGEDPTTPSKRRQRKSKTTKIRNRSPTPPEDLPPHELYFLQNKSGRQKTSDNTLASLALLDHEEYFNIVRKLENPHAEEIQYLHELHSKNFNQWQFELSQGFSICIYGWGSKRSLLAKFAEHIYNAKSLDEQNHKIVIVNGYTHSTTIREIFQTITTAVLGLSHNFKLGSQPTEMLESLLSLLTEAADSKAFQLTLVINSIDAPPLRRSVTQTLLSRLATHPQVSLIASADNPSFPLLWDSSLRSTYNFLFHDCTTFQPYEAELDVIDSVHDLLGRSGRRVGGKEGISFVLKSLPENAKKLFGVLVAEQLAGMDGGAGANIDNDNEDDSGPRQANSRNQEAGVEYRVLYQKAVEEFICSADMGFRTLLKEFYDHQMIESRKDTMGTEILSVPFRKEELETILEDLMS